MFDTVQSRRGFDHTERKQFGAVLCTERTPLQTPSLTGINIKHFLPVGKGYNYVFNHTPKSEMLFPFQGKLLLVFLQYFPTSKKHRRGEIQQKPDR